MTLRYPPQRSTVLTGAMIGVGDAGSSSEASLGTPRDDPSVCDDTHGLRGRLSQTVGAGRRRPPLPHRGAAQRPGHQAVSGGPIGFVIQIVLGKAAGRPGVPARTRSGRDAAGAIPGANHTVRDVPDMA